MRLSCICLIAAVGCAAGDRDHDQGAVHPHTPSAAALRIAATIDRAGLAAERHPEIFWRTNDLLAQGKSAEIVLPRSPDAPFYVKDKRSSARMAVRMLDVRRATAEVVDGRVVYPGGYAKGDVVHQVRESGTEDFVILRERGASSLDYELEIEQGVAGVRFGADTLELLDAGGAPRLRVASPYVVDDAGTRIAASLSVDGCAYDTSPAAPWGRPITSPGAGSCRVHVAWSDAALRYPIIVDPAWLTTNNLRHDREGHSATVLANGLVLLSGGEHWSQNGAVCMGGSELSAELFDPTTATSAFTGSTKYGHWRHRSVTLTSGQVLVAGNDQGGSFSSMELYDPMAGTWSYVSSPEGERAHPGLARLPGGSVMLFGGANSVGTVLKTTMIYTPGTGWVPGASMATARTNLDAVLLDDNSILIVGGTNQAGVDVPSSERYVPGVGWDAPVSLALSAGPTYGTTARLGSGKFLVAMPSASQIYDPSTKQWSSIPSTSVYTPKSASIGNGQVLVLGSISSNATPNAQRYDEVSGWISEASPTVGRYPTDDTLTALPTGDVLVAGGMPLNGCASTAEAEVYKYCPPYTVTPASLPAASVTVAYSQKLGSSGATGAVSYTITSGSLPTGMTLASDGTLSGTPSVGGTFPFTVKATDANGCTSSKNDSFTVNCPAISLSPTTLPYGQGGTFYDQTLSSSGGIGAVTYAVTSGVLPAGVTLTSDGTLSGTPTAVGSFPVTITATDTATCKGSQNYSLFFGCPSFVFSPSSLDDGTEGTPYTVAISVSGAIGTVTYTVGTGAGTPPPGMTLASDGTLGGTPAQAGRFIFIVSARDSNQCMHSALFDLTIDPNPDAGTDDAAADMGSPDPGVDAGNEAGTDAAAPDDGAAPSADAGIVDSGADAAVADSSGDAAIVETGADVSIADSGSDGTSVDAGTDQATVYAREEAATAGPDAAVVDAPSVKPESGSPDRRDAAMDGSMAAEASSGAAAASDNGGCACRQSRRTDSSWPLGGLAFLVLAARRRRSSASKQR